MDYSLEGESSFRESGGFMAIRGGAFSIKNIEKGIPRSIEWDIM